MSPAGDLGCVYEDCYSDKASDKDNTLKQYIMIFILSCRCLLREVSHLQKLSFKTGQHVLCTSLHVIMAC